MTETTRRSGTIEKWWPEIEGFLELGVTNARTEGNNRVIKQINRVACGFAKPGQLRKAHNVAQRSHHGRVTISGQGPA